MVKTIEESGWSVGVSAVKALRNDDFWLRNVSPHSILRIHLNQCRIKKAYCYSGNMHMSVIVVTVSIDLGAYYY